MESFFRSSRGHPKIMKFYRRLPPFLILAAVMGAMCFAGHLLGINKGEPTGPKGTWTTLEGCRFMPSRYHDADSFHVLHGKNEFTFRLYFVDAPETDLRFGRAAQQAGYWGITEGRVLKTGQEASDFVAKILTDEDITIRTRWMKTGGNSKMPRYYAFVSIEGRDLAEVLLKAGYARVHGRRTASPDGKTADLLEARLTKLEEAARGSSTGIWSSVR